MKVLHVHSGNLYGGVETFLLTLVRARRLAPDMDMSVALCFEGRIAAELRVAGIEPVMLGDVRLRRPDKVRRARQGLRSAVVAGSFDVVVCHQAWALAIFGPVARRAGIPLVSWVHMAQTGRHWLERLAGRIEPDLYVCNSRFTASQLPPVRARVEVVYAPVQLDRPTEVSRAGEGGSVVILQVSRLEAWKGQRVLLEALHRMRDDPAWKCWLAGGAQRPAEIRYLAALHADAERLGIDGRVDFLGHRPDVPALLASADIFCQPNIEPEPFGISLVEALAAGLPVVTSATGGALEVVDDTCGVLVDAGDTQALAKALSRLIQDDAWRDELGRRGPDRARMLCDPAVQMTRIKELLESAARARAVAH